MAIKDSTGHIRVHCLLGLLAKVRAFDVTLTHSLRPFYDVLLRRLALIYAVIVRVGILLEVPI